MTFGRFYGHFAAAYGTIWITLMLLAILTQSHIDAGAFGMFGFPVIALLYAALRSRGVTPWDRVARLEARIAELEDRRSPEPPSPEAF